MGNIIMPAGRLAKQPYFFEKTYVNLYSLEELCYVLVENAEMLDNDIVSDKLARWLKEECGLPGLSKKLGALIRENSDAAAFVGEILEYSGLYSEKTRADTLVLITENVDLSPYEKQKARADHMYKSKRLIPALEEYTALLGMLPDAENELRARLHHNMGTIYAGLFMFGHAQEEFKAAYELNGDEESLFHFLAAKRLNDSDRDYVDFIAKNPSLHEASLKVERMVEEAAGEFDATQENRMLFTLHVCKEEGGDVQYYDEIDRLTQMLKDSYRESVSG